MTIIKDIFDQINNNNVNAAFKLIKNNNDQIEKIIHVEFLDPKSISNAIKNLHNNKNKKLFWEKIIYSLDINCLTDELISYLIKNNIAISQLGHSDLDDKWLFILGDKVVEAYQTLILRYFTNGNHYYKSKHATPKEFEDILIQVGSKNKYVVEWAIGYLKPDNLDKVEILYNFIMNNDFDDNIKNKVHKYYVNKKNIGL